MRTTLTIDDTVVQELQQLTGQTSVNGAMVAGLIDYVAMQKRLRLLDRLFTHKIPHRLATIKRQRKKGTWSS